MRMSFIDRILFPKFASYLETEMEAVIKVKSIRDAFLRIGQLDRAGLKQALRWGTPPTVDVVPLPDDYGEFTPTPGNDTFQIDLALVKSFEDGTDMVKNKSGRNVHLAGVTVLHEMIHWADNKDGINVRADGKEEGELFEKAVYGKVLG